MAKNSRVKSRELVSLISISYLILFSFINSLCFIRNIDEPKLNNDDFESNDVQSRDSWAESSFLIKKNKFIRLRS